MRCVGNVVESSGLLWAQPGRLRHIVGSYHNTRFTSFGREERAWRTFVTPCVLRF